MIKCKWLVILGLFIILAQPSFADDDRAKFLGIWKLFSYEMEFQATGERRPALGKNPTGYMIVTAEGRMMTFIEGEGRKPPQTDQDRVALHRSMMAYTGVYRFEGEKFITKVDASWNPAWTGTDIVRFFKFDGDRLQIITGWAPNTLFPGNPMTRGFVIWERTK
jgi:hypothetical protein